MDVHFTLEKWANYYESYFCISVGLCPNGAAAEGPPRARVCPSFLPVLKEVLPRHCGPRGLLFGSSVV